MYGLQEQYGCELIVWPIFYFIFFSTCTKRYGIEEHFYVVFTISGVLQALHNRVGYSNFIASVL